MANPLVRLLKETPPQTSLERAVELFKGSEKNAARAVGHVLAALVPTLNQAPVYADPQQVIAILNVLKARTDDVIRDIQASL